MRLARFKLRGVVLFSVLISTNVVYGAVLHQETTTQTITKGATLTNEKILSEVGWRNINVLRVNLDEPNVALKPIESANGTSRQTVLQMVNDAGAIAGVNSDFFDISTSSTPSFGPVISDGELKHAYNSNYSSLGPNKYMGTFTIDTNNGVSMDYYGVSLRLNANGTFVGAMGGYNNIPSKLYRPVVVDCTYYSNTSSIISKLPNTYTIVVEEDVVTYCSKSNEAVDIPKNGYVILIGEQDANNYYSQLKVGTSVDLQQFLYLSNGLTEAVSNIKLGIGGGGLIMKDGVEYTGAAHKITPTSNDPRTIVATLKNSNEVLLITIDGRGDYKGMTHSDLVTFLKSYNVKDAMYFDGGGSTTMVARNEGETEVTLQNNPSDGSQRKVINGLGVFTTSETGDVAQLIIDTNYNRTFVGESISLTVKAVDENSNPVTLNKDNITYSVAGVNGRFEGNKFIPTSSGKALIIASYDGVEVGTEIIVSEKPQGIRIEPSNLQVDENSTKTVQVYGIDSEGYKLPLTASSITWTSDNNTVGATNNTVVTKGKALATLTANYKGLTAKLGVTVGNVTSAIESFETNTASWGGDTSTVKGSVIVCNDEKYKYHGTKSIKMTYTFDKSPNKQVAYTLFDTPIQIPSDAMSLNMWLYGKKQGHAAKVEVVDSNNKKFYLKLTDNINFEGWKYVSTALPEDMVLPAKVTKFYTYANSVSEKTTTAVYIDHVSITRGFKDREGISVRDDYRFDPWYKETLQDPTGDQYVINAVGGTKVESMLLSKETTNKIANQLSNKSSLVVMASGNNLSLPLTANSIAYKNTYEVKDYSSTRVIMAGTDSGGLRATQASAWLNIKSAISTSNAKNIILVMSKNPLTQFSDTEEGKAFHKYLRETREQTGKNIFVITTGTTGNEVRIEDGIRYIKTSGLNTTTDNVKDASFVKFKMVGDKVYYTFEPFTAS